MPRVPRLLPRRVLRPGGMLGRERRSQGRGFVFGFGLAVPVLEMCISLRARHESCRVGQGPDTVLQLFLQVQQYQDCATTWARRVRHSCCGVPVLSPRHFGTAARHRAVRTPKLRGSRATRATVACPESCAALGELDNRESIVGSAQVERLARECGERDRAERGMPAGLG